MTTETKRVLVQTALVQENLLPLSYAFGNMRNTMPIVLLADQTTVIFKVSSAGEDLYRCDVVLRTDDLEERCARYEAALQEIVRGESTAPFHHLTSVNVARATLEK